MKEYERNRSDKPSCCKNCEYHQTRVYIIYTLENIMQSLGCGNKKAIQLLAELENKANLILRKKQGLGKPNLIYVKKFTVVARAVERHFLKCENDTCGTGKEWTRRKLQSSPSRLRKQSRK